MIFAKNLSIKIKKYLHFAILSNAKNLANGCLGIQILHSVDIA